MLSPQVAAAAQQQAATAPLPPPQQQPQAGEPAPVDPDEGGPLDGFRIKVWRDGSKYAGEWEQNKMSGYGEMRWADGRRCVCVFALAPAVDRE